ncbi:MAG: hypothetical protein CM1200mP13_06910 [Candidatus Pelagibacterales bacterium]|nr:MAG: hypothetical protein CM1200mP13_06910 [Pelagibacterales bacterium]
MTSIDRFTFGVNELTEGEKDSYLWELVYLQ